jgi:hypothetical protein
MQYDEFSSGHGDLSIKRNRNFYLKSQKLIDS